MKCRECGKDLDEAVGEPRAHALNHLSSEARAVAGYLVLQPPEVAAEVAAAFCLVCGRFKKEEECSHG